VSEIERIMEEARINEPGSEMATDEQTTRLESLLLV
jgi:hypothetical protein